MVALRNSQEMGQKSLVRRIYALHQYIRSLFLNGVLDDYYLASFSCCIGIELRMCPCICHRPLLSSILCQLGMACLS